MPDAKAQRSICHMVCLLRTDGATEQEARERGKASWEDFADAFPTSLYTLDPITERRRLYEVCVPIDPEGAEFAEVRKVEEVVPALYEAAGDYFYSFLPVDQSLVPIESVLEPIIRRKTPLVISICLSSTALTIEEEYTLRQVLGELRQFATGFTVELGSGTTMFQA